MNPRPRFIPLLAAVLIASTFASGAEANWPDLGDPELERYFERRVKSIESTGEDDGTTIETWTQRRPELQRQLLDMLGLDPMPQRTPLQPVVTGRLEQPDFTVENLHFQSSPGLYVTANFYLPAKRDGRLPTILYLCGHAPAKDGDVSYGNKTRYHHHAVWFARNGYACLVIDTLQLGEIEGTHHGIYGMNRWWWNARGYTPAGVEAWNCMRALDYLESRPEVDADRIGATGRSGGGAYSWWISAIDERIKVAVPVAGITSMRNHVIDGCIEGHCDCMFPVNTYGWDFGLVAALVAPRPLLISNTDKDRIFPLDGVQRIHRETRQIYSLYGATAKLGLNIEEGPHKDTQPLRTAAFHWFNRHLRDGHLDDTFQMAADKVLDPADLRVFDQLPGDEINTRIDETFVPLAPELESVAAAAEWPECSAEWMRELRTKCFRQWPEELPVNFEEISGEASGGTVFKDCRLQTEPEVSCRLQIGRRRGEELDEPALLVLKVLDDSDFADDDGRQQQWMADGIPERSDPGTAYLWLAPRGIGNLNWPEDPKKRIHIRRRFALVGLTLDAMRVWDICQAIRAARLKFGDHVPLQVEGRGVMAGNVLYAALLSETPVTNVILRDLPSSHREGPVYLNVLRVWDLPQAVAMTAERSAVIIETDDPEQWSFPLELSTQLGWPGTQVQVNRP